MKFKTGENDLKLKYQIRKSERKITLLRERESKSDYNHQLEHVLFNDPRQ